MATDDKTALATTNLPARMDYLRRTLEIVTVDEWGAVVNTTLQLAKAGDHMARRWLADQLGMAQSAQLNIKIQANLEAMSQRARVTAENVRGLSTGDLQALASVAKENRRRMGGGDVVDVTPEREPTKARR